MNETNNDLSRLLEAIEGLRADFARLESRVAQLEAGAERTTGEAGEESDRIDNETIMAISAAVAAFLGKQPHIRAIRLLSSDTWPQVGRATIQAWYSVSSHRTR
jgi:methylmalonyl-CoA carboxyltransferase 12S subunit